MATAESDTGQTTYPIRAVERVCSILDTLANAPAGATLSEVATAAGLPKSSAFRYLSALEARHYVERDQSGNSFQLGVAFRPQRNEGIERLADLARPALEKLRDQLKETTNLGVLDGTHVVHTIVAESPQIMRLAARVGDRGYIHSTALGKVLSATLAEERVRSIIAISGMPEFTDATITDIDQFLQELERTRAQGYGIDEAENQAAGRCIGVVIENIPFLAGISVSAPAERLTKDQVPEVVRRLQQIARSLSRQMRTDL